MLALGEFQLGRVVEYEDPLIAPENFLPESTPEIFAEHAHWLQPRHVDPATGMLILNMQSYIVRTPRATILVDACVGNDKKREGFAAWNYAQGPYLQNLAAAGLRPEDIDYVLCTHLHTDHVGWNTRLQDGRWVPTFPNAKYIFSREEYAFWEATAKAGPETMHTCAFHDSVLPVMEAGRAVLVEDDHEIDHGLWFEPAPGHTPGNVLINLVSGDAQAILSGDVIHHPVQLVRPDWCSRACIDHEGSRRSRRALLERVCETDTLLAPAHFASPSIGHVVREGDHFGFRFRDWD